MPGLRLADPLIVDLYEITMLEAYLARGMNELASFELFVRRLPESRRFILAAGLEQALAFLEGFRFSPDDLADLSRVHPLSASAARRLSDLRFSGDVEAVPEGTVLFAGEPILRVTARLPEAQIVETRLLNLIHFQTLVASKAARAVIAAAGRPLVDFGLRRAHGAEAGLFAARAAYLAGFSGTSNVRAGVELGIPTFGTMAHSFIQAHDDEEEAFASFAAVHGANVALLIDTYDTEEGARKVVDLAQALKRRGALFRAVRIDSGDLAEHARRVRRILDEGGLRDVQIVASSGLDEHAIAALVASGAPIDRFAPGTQIVTSGDAPSLDCAYKLVEYAGRPRSKRAEGKQTWPGRKQVWRTRNAAGLLQSDDLAPASETVTGATPLLEPVMRAGRRLGPSRPLEKIRAAALAEVSSLPEGLRSLEPGPPFSVRVSERLALSDSDATRARR